MTDDRSLDMTPRAEFADRLEASLLDEISAPASSPRPNAPTRPVQPQETIMTIEAESRRSPRSFVLYAAAAAVIIAVIAGIAILAGGGASHESPAALLPTKIPDGVYRNTISVAEVRGVNISTNLGWSGTWTLTIRGDTFQLHCAPASSNGDDCGSNTTAGVVEVGRLAQRGDQVTFTSDTDALVAATGCHVTTDPTDAVACGAPAPYTMTWAAAGDTLTFSVRTPDASTEWNYIIKPMTKVG